jgi:uncharacterized protein YdhG (YjbR/CyaY superfamily)
MTEVKFRSVDEYILSQPEGVRETLERVRGAIRKALPAAEETISYHMPVYKMNGAAVIYFASWKKHYSIYPATRKLIDEFRDELAPYEVEKSTLKLTFTAPVPVKLIGRIARFRAKEAAARGK